MYLASLRLLMTIKAYLLPPFLAATVLLSTERSSIFINPEEYPRDTRDHHIFPYTFYTPFLVSLPDCLVGTVLGRHVHPPTTTHKDIQHAIDAIPVISPRSTSISRKRD